MPQVNIRNNEEMGSLPGRSGQLTGEDGVEGGSDRRESRTDEGGRDGML